MKITYYAGFIKVLSTDILHIDGGSKRQIINAIALMASPSFQTGYLKRFPPQ
jgi:hypothetical protein